VRRALSYSQAALGTQIEVPLLDESTCCHPAERSQAMSFALRGKGMPDPHSRRKGDLLVQMQLEVLAQTQ